jgi:probable phosphoglycerate mutase
MKKVYFVRHGQSEGNASDKYQLDSSSLSALGREQASQIADRATRLPVEALIASSMPRAQETAEFIQTATGLAIESSDLFVERQRPPAQQGLVRTSPEAVAMDEAMIENFAVSGYRLAGEENFDDLKERASKALSYLINHKKDSLLVVTHGLFLRVLLAQASFGPLLTAPVMSTFLGTYQSSNTGLSVFEYDEQRRNPWSIVTWNDHTHLG